MYWKVSWRTDPTAREIADRHYNRQHVGAANFVPPGRCLVLLAKTHDALWVSSWPYAEYCHHAWSGAWICSCFRNESGILSSVLIREAVAATRAYWGTPPDLGFVTFVDRDKTRRKRDPGRCYRRAGWHPAVCPVHGAAVEAGCAACRHETQGGLFALQQLTADMPMEAPATGHQWSLFDDLFQRSLDDGRESEADDDATGRAGEVQDLPLR